MSNFTFRSVATRAIRTAAQTALGAIGGAALIEAVDWKIAASTVALSTLASVLTSIVTGLPEDDAPQRIGYIEHP